MTVTKVYTRLLEALPFAALGIAALVVASGCQTTPTSVEELVTDAEGKEAEGKEAMAIPERAEEMAASSQSPRVLVLGSLHLAGGDYEYPEEAFERVRQRLSEFAPDMVVVEYLPPDWPVGRGRDYRPGFDLEEYAERWEMDRAAARALVERHRADPFSTPSRCKLGAAHFLLRDLANAAYHWLSAGRSGECGKPSEIDEIGSWLEEHARSEYARIGYRLADRFGLPEVVSYDYQGEDAQWFIGPARFLRDLVPFSDVSEANREIDLHVQQHTEDLVSMLDFANSPEWIGLQYWTYEQRHLDVERNEMGTRQVENYWLRNRKMFQNMREAIETGEAQRVLVVTGMGHKYFIDTLVVEAGFRWVDPREYLPEP